MGGGDVKMLAMIGAFLGVKLVLVTFVLSSMIGGLARRRADPERAGHDGEQVPFGTFLARRRWSRRSSATASSPGTSGSTTSADCMTEAGYLLLGLTAIVAALAGSSPSRW